MYTFRTTFELSSEEIKSYMKQYAKRQNRPVKAVVFLVVLILFGCGAFFGIAEQAFVRTALYVGAGVICLALLWVFCMVRKEMFLKKLPFGISPYITLELRDGFLNVNCAGNMKSYSQGSLHMDLNDQGDYIITKKKDMVVVPRRVQTRLIVDELNKYFGEV